MNAGTKVKAVRDIKGRWTTPDVRAGSKGMIVSASAWSDTYTVTFTGQGLLGRGTVTVKDVAGKDLQRG